MTAKAPGFETRLGERFAALSPAERQVAEFMAANREEVLVASAARLAEAIGTSDATVVRTSKALGYLGLNELRRDLAAELRENLSPAVRLTRTLSTVGPSTKSAFQVTIATHLEALRQLERDIMPETFAAVIKAMAGANRVVVFGIGPSSAIADYLVTQLSRFGRDAISLTQTGLLLADSLNRLRAGDLIVVLAYGRVNREVDVLLGCAKRLKLKRLLITDTLGRRLASRVDFVLPVARGRANMFSMHTTTLGLIEAMLVAIAAAQPDQTLTSLTSLNRMRHELTGQPMNLPTPGSTKAADEPNEPGPTAACDKSLYPRRRDKPGYRLTR